MPPHWCSTSGEGAYTATGRPPGYQYVKFPLGKYGQSLPSAPKRNQQKGKVSKIVEIPKELGASDDPAELPPGEYMTRPCQGYEGEWNLESVRYHLLTHGINPSINIAWTRDGPIYTKLWYPGKDGKVAIQATQLGWQESQAFAKTFFGDPHRLTIPFANARHIDS